MATIAVITRTEDSVNLVWVLIEVSYAGINRSFPAVCRPSRSR